MRVFANSIPKSGTHLLLRLLTLLDFEIADFGGLRPTLVSEEEDTKGSRLLRSVFGTREPGKFLGVGPHLVEAGRFPPARRLIRNRGPEKVLVGVDSPKEIGARWLEGRLAQVPDGALVSAHCVYTPELSALVARQKMRTVCIIRDPRDTAVSHMRYVQQRPKHLAYKEFMSLPDDHERLMVSIRGADLGGHVINPLDERYRRFTGWEREGGAVMVKFEELVGPMGGGSERAQRDAVERVAKHLDVELDEVRLRSVQQNLFGSGRTFRKGQAGGWKQEFSEEHRQATKEVAGELLVDLGYERDLGW